MPNPGVSVQAPVAEKHYYLEIQGAVLNRVVIASSGSILSRIFSRAMVWLQVPQFEKKWQVQLHFPS